MKKFLLLSGLLMALFLPTSCVVDMPYKLTQSGYVAFKTTEKVLVDYATTMRLAMAVNEYIYAPAEHRDSIQKLYFPESNISQDGNEWTVGYQTRQIIYTFNTNGMNLNTVGTIWFVTERFSGNPSTNKIIIPANGFMITRADEATLNLEINDAKTLVAYEYYNSGAQYAYERGDEPAIYPLDDLVPYSIGDATLSFAIDKTFGSKLKDISFYISGFGNFNTMPYDAKNFLTVHYSTDVPLYLAPYTYSPNYFIDGKMHMTAFSQNEPTPREVIADLTESRGGLIALKITFMEETEVW